MKEKRKPSYSLKAIKSAFASVDGLNATTEARLGMARLGFDLYRVVSVIKSIKSTNFHKSAISHYDESEWLDVYHVPLTMGLLYVKFKYDQSRKCFVLVSFKEK